MAEFIERELLINRIEQEPTDGMFTDEILNAIAEIPSADVAPVVHGRWKTKYKSGVKPHTGFVASCCNVWNNRKSNYCPYCGAKMDG